MNKQEWQAVIEQEQSELFLVSLLDDVLKAVDNILHEKRIASLLIPYTLDFCQKEILDTIDAYYMKIFEVETLEELAETVELGSCEPAQIRIDSWATGHLPVRQVPPSASSELKRDDARLSVSHANSPSPTRKFQLSLPTASNSSVNSEKDLFQKQNTAVSFVSAIARTSSSDGKRAPSGSHLDYSRKSISQTKKPQSSFKRGFTTEASVDEEIIEENQKTLLRLSNIDRNHERSNYSYDKDGRIIMIPSRNKVASQSSHGTDPVVKVIEPADDFNALKSKLEAALPRSPKKSSYNLASMLGGSSTSKRNIFKAPSVKVSLATGASSLASSTSEIIPAYPRLGVAAPRSLPKLSPSKQERH